MFTAAEKRQILALLKAEGPRACATSGGDVRKQFGEAVRAQMAKGKTRHEAVAAVAKKDPALHKAFLALDHKDYRPR